MSRQTTGVTVLSWSPFNLFLGILGWLGDLARDWIHGKQRVDVVGEEDELEEDVEQCLSCLEGVFEVDEDPENELDKPGTTTGTKFSVLHLYSNTVFDEMWFLTINPFVGISVFIAKLSKRQYCWRVFEDFHSQEFFQFFDVHCSLFMRLHFSIGGYDYRWTTRLRQGIHFSIIQVLFADHMHRRTGVDNKFSFLKFKS